MNTRKALAAAALAEKEARLEEQKAKARAKMEERIDAIAKANIEEAEARAQARAQAEFEVLKKMELGAKNIKTTVHAHRRAQIAEVEAARARAYAEEQLLMDKEIGATKIQAHVRGRKARTEVKKLKQINDDADYKLDEMLNFLEQAEKTEERKAPPSTAFEGDLLREQDTGGAYEKKTTPENQAIIDEAKDLLEDCEMTPSEKRRILANLERGKVKSAESLIQQFKDGKLTLKSRFGMVLEEDRSKFRKTKGSDMVEAEKDLLLWTKRFDEKERKKAEDRKIAEHLEARKYIQEMLHDLIDEAADKTDKKEKKQTKQSLREFLAQEAKKEMEEIKRTKAASGSKSDSSAV